MSDPTLPLPPEAPEEIKRDVPVAEEPEQASPEDAAEAAVLGLPPKDLVDTFCALRAIKTTYQLIDCGLFIRQNHQAVADSLTFLGALYTELRQTCFNHPESDSLAALRKMKAEAAEHGVDQ